MGRSMLSPRASPPPPPPFRWHYAEYDDGNFQLPGQALFFIALAFSIILLAALIFVCTRRLCRRPTPSTPALPPCRAAVYNAPIVLYRNSGGEWLGEEAECCICLGVFGDKEKVKMLPECRHFFHPDCVDTWLATQSSCPLCRASLQVDSPV